MFDVWWTALSAGMKVIWIVTIAATFIFIVQSIMTFVGGGSSDLDSDLDINFDGTDADVPDAISGGTGMNLYTFRNLVNFCLGFGWTFIILQGKIGSTTLLVIVSVLVGIALVAIVMYMFKWLWGMQQSGNINLAKSAPGCTGTVYLSIPAARKGEGKVQITINNAVREYAAVTDGEAIPTGASIVVQEAIGPNLLLVKIN
ncbi:MAG: hypothetical protein IJ151_06145 [Bacteroidales bacterium]|nr:hypothetical protein [Bacteroidales bacterium]